MEGHSGKSFAISLTGVWEKAQHPREGFRDCLSLDMPNRVLEDCVSGADYESHEAALKSMEYLQAGAVMMSEDMIKVVEAK